jgi:excisionase family DNA binding protein
MTFETSKTGLMLTNLPPDKLISTADAAVLLGKSRRSVQRLITSRALPAFVVGLRSVRVRAGDLQALVKPWPREAPSSPLALTVGAGRAY